MCGNKKKKKRLLDRGLDPRDRHGDGFEPLHRTCWGNEERHAKAAKVLIKKGNVPWDAKALNGKTCVELSQPGTPVYKYFQKLQAIHLKRQQQNKNQKINNDNKDNDNKLNQQKTEI